MGGEGGHTGIGRQVIVDAVARARRPGEPGGRQRVGPARLRRVGRNLRRLAASAPRPLRAPSGWQRARPTPARIDGSMEHRIDPELFFRKWLSMIIIVAATNEVRITRAEHEIHTLERTAK